MVLYMDIDGVLHRLGSEAIHHLGYILWDSPELFIWRPLLIKALKPYPEVRIVISSSWRFMCDDDDLRDRVLGPDLGRRFAGITSEEHPRVPRTHEILEHVRCNRIAQWLALDDDPTVQLAARTDARFIYCPPQRGLSSPTVLKRLRAALRKGREAGTGK